MVQIIDDKFSGNVLGRLGAGIGQGLSEQVPKEVERYRLSSGLKKLNQENIKDPLEYYTRALGIPGITPQMVESLGRLAQQRLQNQSLLNQYPQGSLPGENQPGGNISTREGTLPPSIGTPKGTQATISPYISPEPEQLEAEATRLFRENPGRFKNDWQNAYDLVTSREDRKRQKNLDEQAQRTGQASVENTLKTKLQNQAKRYGAETVPGNELEAIENLAVKSVLPKSQGGEELPEEQAAKKYSKMLDAIGRDYSSLNSKKGLTKYTRSSDIVKELEPMRKRFEERGMLENFADTIQSKLTLSPKRAYAIAYPLDEKSPLFQGLEKLPKLNPAEFSTKAIRRVQSEKFIPQIADDLGNASPLAVADYLQKKGYDADSFLDYLIDNEPLFDFSEQQQRELSKSRKTFGAIGNIFFDTFKRKK